MIFFNHSSSKDNARRKSAYPSCDSKKQFERGDGDDGAMGTTGHRPRGDYVMDRMYGGFAQRGRLKFS